MKETRTVDQIKLYKLILNHMRDCKIEITQIVAASYDKQALIDWYNEQKAEKPWKDGQWGKTFKKDSPLEWYNGTSNFDGLGPYNDGICEEWAFEKDVKEALNYRGIPFIE